jgi:hypothetical protein
MLLPLSLGGGSLVVVALLALLLGGNRSGTPASNRVEAAETAPLPPDAVALHPVAFVEDSPEERRMRELGLFKVKRIEPEVLRSDPSFENIVRPFVSTYCIDCHTGDDAGGGVQLERYDNKLAVFEDRETWNRVLGILKIGAMPPQEAELPENAEREVVVNWIEETLFGFDCKSIDDPGRETIQRLNITEYSNTIRDLLGIEFEAGRDFPADDVGQGFDNIGDVLTLPPLLMEKYLSAGEEIAATVVLDTRTIPETRIGGRDFKITGSANGSRGSVSFPSNATATVAFKFPARGEYIIRATARATQAGKEPAEMLVELDGKEVKREKIPEHNEQKVYEYKVPVEAGTFDLSISFTNDFYDPKHKDPKLRDRNLFLDQLEVVGPLAGVDVDLPQSHRDFVLAMPDDDTSVRDAALEVFRNFMPRAFRRPVEEDEVARVADLVVHFVEEYGESYEEGLRVGLQAVLVSPSFLFRIEADPRPEDAEYARHLNDFELASRISYFLWSSMPDEELFQLAREGKLSRPEEIDRQIERMLADPKAQALVENFGGQWLNLRNLNDITFDRRRYRDFDDNLRKDMLQETLMFFEHVMRDDRSLLDLLFGKYTFVNSRLASHYGLEGVEGDEFRQVSLEGQNRAGVLTQSSILALTSNPTRTSPVKRGKWVLENILGTPPPPPPPGVPELEETSKASPDATLSEQLALHREDPGCATCHNQMDPIGLAFERFDAIGRYRERDGNQPIDDCGVLPDGRAFQGAMELLEALETDKRRFLRNLTEKMLTYALGRGLEYYDSCSVDQILADLEKNDYKFSQLVRGVILSDPFLKRRGEGGNDR